MVTRTARGRRLAAGARGLLIAWAAVAVVGAGHAQQFAERAEFSLADGDTIVPEGDFQPSEPPDYWDDDYDASGYCGCGDACDECGDACCDCQPHGTDCTCCCVGGVPRWWIGADYLVWRINGTDLPPLVVDSPLGTSPVLGLSTTSELAGGDTGNDFRNGYRLRAGTWLDECHTLGIAGEFFELGEDDDGDFFYAGNSGRNTSRPFFNAQTGLQSGRLISGPNTTVDGTVAVEVDDDFEGAGAWLEQSIYAIGDVSGYGPGTEVILISGYRYYGLDSRLSVSDAVTTQSGPNAGDQSFKRDDFLADNEFHGGEIGVRFRFTQRNFWFDGLAMLAIGGNDRTVTIDGETTTIPAGMAAQTDAGGLLTSSETNIGRYSDSEAQVIPEFRIGFGVILTPNWIARVGYNVIVWSDVARAAGQLPPNLAVDPRNIPPVSAGGGASPLFPGIGGSEFVAHGLDLGLECDF